MTNHPNRGRQTRITYFPKPDGALNTVYRSGFLSPAYCEAFIGLRAQLLRVEHGRAGAWTIIDDRGAPDIAFEHATS